MDTIKARVRPRHRLDRRFPRLILPTNKLPKLQSLVTNSPPNILPNNPLRLGVIPPLPQPKRNKMARINPPQKQLHRALASKSLDARTPRRASPIPTLTHNLNFLQRNRDPPNSIPHTIHPKLHIPALHKRTGQSRLEHLNPSTRNPIQTQSYIVIGYN